MSVKQKEENWYCVRSKTRREHIAAAFLLETRRLEVFCPRLRMQRNTERGKVWFEEAMFPGYFFARFDFEHDFKIVSYSYGVTGIVHFGDKYAAIPDQSIEELKLLVDNCGMREISDNIKEGDEVIITDGPFTGLSAMVTKKMSASERIRVLFDFLGAQVNAELSESAVVRKASQLD